MSHFDQLAEAGVRAADAVVAEGSVAREDQEDLAEDLVLHLKVHRLAVQREVAEVLDNGPIKNEPDVRNPKMAVRKIVNRASEVVRVNEAVRANVGAKDNAEVNKVGAVVLAAALQVAATR